MDEKLLLLVARGLVTKRMRDELDLPFLEEPLDTTGWRYWRVILEPTLFHTLGDKVTTRELAAAFDAIEGFGGDMYMSSFAKLLVN